MTKERKQYYIAECARIAGCTASYGAIKDMADKVISRLTMHFMFQKAYIKEKYDIEEDTTATFPSISKEDSALLHEIIHDDDEEMKTLAVNMVIASVAGIIVSEIEHRTNLCQCLCKYLPKEDILQNLFVKTNEYICKRYDPSRGAKYSTILKRLLFCWMITMSVDELRAAKMITVNKDDFKLVVRAICNLNESEEYIPDLDDICREVDRICLITNKLRPSVKTIKRAYHEYYHVATISVEDLSEANEPASEDMIDPLLAEIDDSLQDSAADRCHEFMQMLWRRAPRSVVVSAFLKVCQQYLQQLKEDPNLKISKAQLIQDTISSLGYGETRRNHAIVELNRLFDEMSAPAKECTDPDQTVLFLNTLEVAL